MTDLDFSSFEPLTSTAWRALIERDLKGRPFETLQWEVEPGIVLQPFYSLEDATEPVSLALPDRSAQVVQYLDSPDATAAREALQNGAEALFFDADDALPANWPDAPTWFAPDLRAALAAAIPDPVIDGLMLREAGATRVETLAWMAAQASAWFDTAGSKRENGDLEAVVAVGPGLMAEIAFMRALRVVLSNVAAAYDAGDAEIRVLAVTSRYHQTAYAAHTNLLRNTLAATAAIASGVDALCVRPHDSITGTTKHGLRLARQTHLLLRDESHLARVVDPAAGSYAVEQLTRAFAEAAWNRFGEIEAAGGLFDAADRIDLAGLVQRQHEERQRAVLDGRQRIVGITRSPHPADRVSVLPTESDAPLGARRLTEPFESIRYAAAQRSASTTIQLLVFGDPAQRNARAGFSRDFFGIAGISVEEVQVIDEVDPNASLIVLCAGDDDYATDGGEQIQRLQAHAPDAAIWVAGTPDAADALRDAGARFFLSARTPLYDHLRDALAALDLLD